MLLVLAFTFVAPILAQRQDGYTMEINTGNRYKVLTDKTRLLIDARAECQASGAELASIHSYEEWQFVKDLLVKSGLTGNAWLGGNDIEEEGFFVWTDGSGPVTFTDWMPGRPQNNSKWNCITASYWNDWKWYGELCDWTWYAVCKISEIQTIEIVGYFIPNGEINCCKTSRNCPFVYFGPSGEWLCQEDGERGRNSEISCDGRDIEVVARELEKTNIETEQTGEILKVRPYNQGEQSLAEQIVRRYNKNLPDSETVDNASCETRGFTTSAFATVSTSSVASSSNVESTNTLSDKCPPSKPCSNKKQGKCCKLVKRNRSFDCPGRC